MDDPGEVLRPDGSRSHPWEVDDDCLLCELWDVSNPDNGFVGQADDEDFEAAAREHGWLDEHMDHWHDPRARWL